MTLSSDSSDTYTSTAQSSHPPANTALPPHPCLQTSYPSSAHSVSSPSAPSPPPLLLLSFYTFCLLLLTLSGFSNGMPEVFEPEALNYFTFFRPTLLTLFVSRNPILTPLPLSGFLDSLLCVLIAPTPGLAFSLLMSRRLAAVSSFSSGRAYLSLNFLPSLFLRSIPTLIMLWSTSLLTTPPRCHFLMCTPPIRSSPTDGKTDSFSPSILPSSRISSFWGTSIAITPSGIQDVLPTPTKRKY